MIAFGVSGVRKYRWILHAIFLVALFGAQKARADELIWQTGKGTNTLFNLGDAAVYAYTFDFSKGSNDRRVATKLVPYFNSPYGRKWLEKPMPRAIALGYPETCGFSWQSWNADSQRGAARMALEQCLIKVRRIQEHQPARCGCLLAAVDNQIFIEPEKFVFPSYAPIVVVDRSTEDERAFPALMKHSGFEGEDLPIAIFDANGEKLCKGTYGIGTLGIPGDFSLRCFKEVEELSGSVNIVGLLLSAEEIIEVNFESRDKKRFDIYIGQTISEFANN